MIITKQTQTGFYHPEGSYFAIMTVHFPCLFYGYSKKMSKWTITFILLEIIFSCLKRERERVGDDLININI